MKHDHKGTETGNHQRIRKMWGRYRITGSTGGTSHSKNQRSDRSLQEQPERSPLQKRTSEDGRTETWSSGIPEESWYREIPYTDRKTWSEKIISWREPAWRKLCRFFVWDRRSGCRELPKECFAVGFHVGLPKELIALPIRVCYNIKDCGQENVPETTEKNISSSWWFFQ